MRVNDAGRELVRKFEGCRLEAYTCPAGKVTIGYGHTGDVKLGSKITQHVADVILDFDLEKFGDAVSNLAPTANANQHAALTSLAYNIGLDALRKSTLLKMLNGGLPVAAAAQFSKWVHAGNVVLPGLVKRRAAEADLFMQAVH